MGTLIGMIMGFRSDWNALSHTTGMLGRLGIPYEVKVISAYHTPSLFFQYAEEAEGRGLEVIVAGTSGAAHLPSMYAARTHPSALDASIQSSTLSGINSLLFIMQMPTGVPIATSTIGKADAINTALLSANIFGAKHSQYHEALKQFHASQTKTVLDNPSPRDARDRF